MSRFVIENEFEAQPPYQTLHLIAVALGFPKFNRSPAAPAGSLFVQERSA